MELLKNYINGGWKESRESNFSEVINPADQSVLARVPSGSKTAQDVDDAVIAAQKAFFAWSSVILLDCILRSEAIV